MASPAPMSDNALQPKSASHQCAQCGRSYSRSDHLARHIRAHSNEKSFSCTVCGKAFARLDILRRHSALHTDRCRKKFSSKTSKACAPCAATKLKCQDEKPCQRCRRRGLRCGMPREEANVDADGAHALTVPRLEFRLGLTEEPSNRDLRDADISYNLSSSLLPTSNQETALDGDWLGNVFGSTASEHCDDSVVTRLFEQGHCSFDNSIWSSSSEDEFPPSISGSFNEVESWLIMSNDIDIPILGNFDQRIRDNLLAIFSKNIHVDRPQPEFPSMMVMNILTHRYLTRQDIKTDSWIHTPTFTSDAKRVELAGMVVAASALSTQFHSLRQFGYQLHKTLQPVILRKLESRSRLNARLQLLQSCLIGLELDLWHGQDHGFHQSGRLASLVYNLIRSDLRKKQWLNETTLPPSGDDDKWKSWVEAESYKRLISHFYVYENQLSMTLNTRSIVSFSDHDRLSSPHPRSLWLARNATEWVALYNTLSSGPAPSFAEALTYSPIFSDPAGFCDAFQIIKLAFHVLGGSIVDIHLVPIAFPRDGKVPQSVQQRKEELKFAIQDFERVFNTVVGVSAIGSFIVSYLTMRLAVSIEQIEILVGKEGEQEDRRIYRILKHWTETTEARQAVWHAGQTLRHYRLLSRISSFQVAIAYHAGLVLFAYSILQRKGGSISNQATTSPDQPTSPAIILNGTSLAHADAFINNGTREPMLLEIAQAGAKTSPTCSLQKGHRISHIVSDIIRDRATESGELSPRLVHGLTTLLTDLGAVFCTPTEDDFEMLLLDSELELDPFTGVNSMGWNLSQLLA